MTKSLVSWRPFTHMKTALPPIAIHRAHGTKLFAPNGRDYIDAISSWWVITHGHCHPHVVDAVTKTAREIDQMVFANFTHAPAQNLLEKLAEMLPDSLRAAFFSDNGSTSVEVALKMALQFWQLAREPHRYKIVSFLGAYHGDTAGCMSVSARGIFTEPYQKMLFDVVRFEDALTSLTDDVAAIIIEPLVQGTGGMIMWDHKVLLDIVAHARRNNIIVIFDEVMTGFYRTGTKFAFEQLGVEPDILCLSKGLTGGFLPLALTICQQKIYDAFLDNQSAKMFFHGHTFTANPLSCAAAVANLQLFDEHVPKRIARIAAIHRERLGNCDHPRINNKRQQGTIAALDVNSDDGYLSGFAPRMMNFSLERGVYLRPIGNVVYVMPPYCITDDELHFVWDVIDDALQHVVSY